MKLLVTGGIGNVGLPLVRRLVSHGHQVKIIDRKSSDEVAGCELVQCDITDFNALKDQVKGQDAIIHLAGLPDPNAGPGPEIFRINCLGTYNLYEAAAQAGVNKVVCASSINAFGFNFGIRRFPIQYFPIDEDHPGVTTDPYSFSKETLEGIAAYYWRREGIASLCFRLPWVYQQSLVDLWMGKSFFEGYRGLFEQVETMPKEERQKQMGELVAWHDGLRSQRVFEKPWEESDGGAAWFPDGLKRLMFFGWTDFWSVISADDSAQAFEKAVQTPFTGSHALFIHEHHNAVGIEAERLAQVFYPEVTARKRPLVGAESLVDMSRAQTLIGYAPEHALTDLISG